MFSFPSSPTFLLAVSSLCRVLLSGLLPFFRCRLEWGEEKSDFKTLLGGKTQGKKEKKRQHKQHPNNTTGKTNMPRKDHTIHIHSGLVSLPSRAVRWKCAKVVKKKSGLLVWVHLEWYISQDWFRICILWYGRLIYGDDGEARLMLQPGEYGRMRWLDIDRHRQCDAPIIDME